MNRKRQHQLLIRLNDEELARVKQRSASPPPA
jgi:hypothetical protein